jgi:hypothetical protein
MAEALGGGLVASRICKLDAAAKKAFFTTFKDKLASLHGPLPPRMELDSDEHVIYMSELMLDATIAINTAVKLLHDAARWALHDACFDGELATNRCNLADAMQARADNWTASPGGLSPDWYDKVSRTRVAKAEAAIKAARDAKAARELASAARLAPQPRRVPFRRPATNLQG